MRGGGADADPSADAAGGDRATAAAVAPRGPSTTRGVVLLFAAYAGLGVLVLEPALSGEFLSDDYAYVVENAYTAAPTFENLKAVFDPFGLATLKVSNYAPVHQLAVTLERQIFADRVFGYHLTNILVHALCAVLLVVLLRDSGAAFAPAAVAGALFVVHPANVESVAWISQLKAGLALAFALGAVIAHRRHPAASTALFAVGLLCKPPAAFALPMAASLAFVRRGGPEGDLRHWIWLGVQAALLGLFFVAQRNALQFSGVALVPAFEDPFVHLRTIASVGARYLAMAATSYGVSAWQEPRPALSVLDPWWLIALPLGALLAWRAVSALVQRRDEAAWWIAAAASFAPVSQIIPFINPMADRFLYFILPGLLGGVVLAGTDGAARLRARLETRGRGEWMRPIAVATSVLVLAVGTGFALHAHARARLWQDEMLLLYDAAENYPDGPTAHLMRARAAARAGDADLALSSLRSAADRGYDGYRALQSDPNFESIRELPAFRALVAELALRWIEEGRARGQTSQAWLRSMALAHAVREEWEASEAMFERALAGGGPFDAKIREELALLRAEQGRTALRDGRR